MFKSEINLLIEHISSLSVHDILQDLLTIFQKQVK